MLVIINVQTPWVGKGARSGEGKGGGCPLPSDWGGEGAEVVPPLLHHKHTYKLKVKKNDKRK